MDPWSVEEELARLGLPSSGDARVDVLRRVADAYAACGVLDREQRRVRLSSGCPRHGICWRDGRRALAPADPDYDAVALPWVGTRYLSERILVVGTNFSSGGGLGAHWDVCRGHIRDMRAGAPGLGGRPYAARAMSAVRAIRDGRAGRLTRDWRPPPHAELADDWESVAYVQAVKCSPETPRGEPFPEMYVECPPLTLMPEIEVLKPRVAVVFGRSHVRDGIRPMLRARAALEWGRAPGGIERDEFAVAGRSRTLFSLNHPSGRDARDWERSLAQLVETLVAEPLPR